MTQSSVIEVNHSILKCLWDYNLVFIADQLSSRSAPMKGFKSEVFMVLGSHEKTFIFCLFSIDQVIRERKGIVRKIVLFQTVIF